jgi:RNA polymerase sigma-70 factor, ECF subfamily
VATQPSTVPSMYTVRARTKTGPDSSMNQQSVVSYETAQAVRPAHGSSSSANTAVRAPVAIIPEMRWEELSDEALIARYQAEADKSLAEQYVNELFSRHHVKVARWCFSVTGDRESAADLAQEICVKAYQNLSCFKGQSKFSTWLYSITRNHCLNAVRARMSRPEMDSDEAVMETLPDLGSDSPLASLERKQQAEIARQLINENLEETEKAVFTLHFSEELPLEAITRMLKLENTSGAKAYLVSAKRKLDRAARRWKARA